MGREPASLLAEVPFFAGLQSADLSLLASASREERFETGSTIFAEGSRADRLYIILEGTVEVWKDYGGEERDLLAVHGPGHLFGEMALIDDLPRSATVVAREPARLLSIGRDDFHRIVADHSTIALSITRSVSAMVRSSNESFVASLHRRNRELLKANRELRRTRQELLVAERLSALGKFSTLILHDIRNPIAILKGFAEMAQMHPKDHELVRRNLSRIMAEADRLGRLASELLDFSRGEIALQVSVIDLRELIARLASIMAERFQSRGVKVVTRIDYPGPVILDADRMLRVLINLADNARKAMPRGGTFTIATSRDGANVVIEVSDTGVGMTDEVRGRIFEPFFSSSEEGGTGLGLCAVKNVVEAHHGRLAVESEKGRGTTFRISIPVAG